MKKTSLKVIGGKKIGVRCSSLPLFFSCSPALTNPDKLTAVRVENGYELLGNLIHAAIQKAIETGDVDLRQIEARYSEADLDRARLLFYNGLKTVEDAKKDMKNPQFEVEVAFETEKYSVTGHVDVLDISDNRAFILDFKTGRTRDDHYHQMVGYAVGAWTKVGRPRGFTVHIAYVYLETNESTPITLTDDDLRAWITELDALPPVYAVNRRCVYCPLHDSCPVFRTYVKGGMGFLLDVANAPDSIRKMDEKALSRLATALKVAEDSKTRIREYIKDQALKSGKDLEIGNGDKFTITTQKRRVLLTAKALPVLKNYVTPKQLASATTLSLSALTSAAMGRAKGGMRAVIRTEIEKRLRDAGAIIETESAQLRTVFSGDKRWPKKKPKK